MALAQIGVKSINSLDESSLAAQLCKLYYNKLRDSMLTSLNWNFSRSIDLLPLTTDEVFNWVYVYQYPVNCLKIYRLIPDYETLNSESSGLRPRAALEETDRIEIEEPEYQIFNINGDKRIATNYENVRIEYNKAVTDTNLFPLNFQLALASLLASTIVVQLADVKEGLALQRNTMQQYMAYRQQAMVDDANEMNYNIPDSEFIRIRR